MMVLLTRPRPDAEALAAALAGDGIDSVIAPVMEIVFESSPVDLEGVQAILFTSANGVRAFARAEKRRDLPAYAVGDATAREAEAAGFGQVESAGGDVEDLAALARKKLSTGAGALLHVSGHRVAGNLAGTLERDGFTVRRAVLYRAETVGTLPAAARDALAGGEIDAVPFFSPRTARTFVTLVSEAGLTTACRKIGAFCLSRAVADALGESAVEWASVEIAERPDQAALAALLRRAARKTNGSV